MEIKIKNNRNDLKFNIDDWAAINKEGALTEVGLVILSSKSRDIIRNSLEFFFGISVYVMIDGEASLLILPKPTVFEHNPRENKLTLEYYK